MLLQIKKICIRYRFISKYYDPEYADTQAQKRKKQLRIRPVTDNTTIKALITTYLKQRLAPNTMKGRAILETGFFPVSVKTIYAIIAQNALQGENLYTYLPYQRKRRKKRRINRNISTFEPQKTQIDERSPAINNRSTNRT